MLAQITNLPASTAQDIAKVFSDFHINVDASQIAIGLLVLSKLAQVAYKHWTTEGTALDKICKTVGVVQDASTAVMTPDNGVPGTPNVIK